MLYCWILRYKDENYKKIQLVKMKMHLFAVSSHLDCNNSLLYGLPHNLLSSLQRVQNSAAHLITGTKRREHISPILRDLRWLTVKDRILFKILLLTYKAVHGHTPAYIRNLISFTTLKSLRSAGQLALKPGPLSKTSSYGDRAFAVAAPKLWNNIPYNIRAAASIGQFKTQLKTSLALLNTYDPVIMVMFLGHVKTEQGRKRLENNNELSTPPVIILTPRFLISFEFECFKI